MKLLSDEQWRMICDALRVAADVYEQDRKMLMAPPAVPRLAEAFVKQRANALALAEQIEAEL